MISNGIPITPSHLFKQGGKFYLPTGSPQFGRSLLVFVAEWCGYCRALSQTLADITREFPLTVYILDDSFPYTSMCMEEMGVSGFPTIFKIRSGGELVLYNGPRDKEGLLALP